jgi:hypothetical protein
VTRSNTNRQGQGKETAPAEAEHTDFRHDDWRDQRPAVVSRRQRRIRTAEVSPGCRALVEIVRRAEQLDGLVREFCARHGPRCRCRLCTFIRTGRYAGDVFDAITALKVNLESNTAAITCLLPFSFHDQAVLAAALALTQADTGKEVQR